MSIVLFNDITTEETLRQLEVTGEKYKDLYVDMNEKEQRKYVKDSASVINDMLKKLERARIDKSKEYKARVEAEAKSIRERLQAANEPFTALIDAYNIERKKILDAKKAKEDAIELARLIESDHEIALILNTQWDNDKEKREDERKAAQEAHDKEVAERAIHAEKARIEAEEKRKEAERIIRESCIENKRSVNNAAVESLMSTTGLDHDTSVNVIKAIAKKQVANVFIKY
jgi:hypothetical protein